MAKPHFTDARQRPFTQVRLYGDLAEMVEQRALRENKSRSTLVDELLRTAWTLQTAPSSPTPIEPDPTRHRARVYGAPRLHQARA